MYRVEGFHFFLAAAFLQPARMLFSSSLPLGTDVCLDLVPDELKGQLILGNMSSSIAHHSYVTELHTVGSLYSSLNNITLSHFQVIIYECTF